MTMKLVIACLASVTFVSIVHAQEVIVEGDAPVVEQAPNDEAVIIQDTNPAPRVYGWTLRPADCGTFRYWNGERCADARNEPPVSE